MFEWFTQQISYCTLIKFFHVTVYTSCISHISCLCLIVLCIMCACRISQYSSLTFNVKVWFKTTHLFKNVHSNRLRVVEPQPWKQGFEQRQTYEIYPLLLNSPDLFSGWRQFEMSHGVPSRTLFNISRTTKTKKKYTRRWLKNAMCIVRFANITGLITKTSAVTFLCVKYRETDSPQMDDVHLNLKFRLNYPSLPALSVLIFYAFVVGL